MGSSTSAGPGFLAGGGEVGALMREHDWSNSPLGAPETWPQSLRSVVGLLLSSKFPMFVAWGNELGFLYNDAYAEILSAKHPQALGKRFYDIWSEIWPDISPLIDASMAGQATYRENLPLLMNRSGFDEQTWFTFSYSPVRDESGKVAGMFCACTETTKQVLAERGLRDSEERQAFLLKLSDALRPLADPAQIQAEAMRVLGEHLGALRAQYYEAESNGEYLISTGGYTDGVPPVIEWVRMDDFGVYVKEAFRAGQTLAVADVSVDPRVSKAELAAYDSLGFRAFVGVPLVKEGRFVVGVGIHHAQPHNWTNVEIALIEETAERTWSAVERARAEEQLRLREAELARVQRIGNVGGVHIEVGPTGFVGHRSPEYLRLHGLSADAARETHADWMRRVHPDDRERADRAFQTALASSEGSYECEYRIVRPSDGAERWISAKGDIERDAEGRALRMIGAHIDITERKRAEAALRESEEKYRSIFESIDQGFCIAEIIVDESGAPVDYKFLETNRVFEAQTGLVDAVGRTALELVPDLERGWIENYGAIALTGRSRRFEQTSQPMGRWFDVYASRVGGESSRKIAIVFSDITARKRAEEALRDSETRLRHIIDSATEYAIITLDRNGRIRSWNAGAERLLGYSEVEILDQPGEIFFSPEDRTAGQPLHEMRLAQDAGRAANERWHIRKDGSRFWGSGVMLTLKDGAPDMFLKIFRDRTEERRAEERRQVLINELNHRVKNTLATVQAIASQTLRGSNVERELRDAFEARLRALAAGHDVLTQESWERADLRQIAAYALQPFEAVGAGRLSIEGSALYVAPKPALSLSMALHELATNATKYGALSNESGSVRVRWTIENNRMRLRWEESGGPRVTAPSHKGFGSRLIERSLANDLEAQVGIEFAPTGVVCTIEAPIEALRETNPTVESMIGGGLYE